jgi:outer membrane protein assembly factor BamE (lipoprotein component of BamABCDE complex)
VSAIHQAEVLEGMTKEQVLMALGYPPARLTPSLNSPNWRYLDGGKRTLEIFFEDGVVGRIVPGK